MQKCNRGNITIFFLGMCFFLAAAAQVLLYYTAEEYARVYGYIKERQLRLLCSSAFCAIASGEDIQREFVIKEMLGAEEQPVLVRSSGKRSRDDLLSCLEVSAAAVHNESAVQRLRQLSINFHEQHQIFAGQYALVSKNIITGQENLPAGTLYTSGQEILVPAIDFLEGRSVSVFGANGPKINGLSRQFYYFPKFDSTYTFPGGGTIRGAALMSTHGHFVVEAGSVFPDRLILIADAGNIDIKENVKMDQVLIIAAGEVRVASGCEINGLVMANRISIQGTSFFRPDEKVVAPFSSIAFIGMTS